MPHRRPLAADIGASLFLLVVALLPFERIPSFQLAGYTVKLSYVVSLVLLAALAVSGQWRRLRPWLATASDRCLAALWGIGLVSVMISPDKKRSIVILALWGFMFIMYGLARRYLAEAPIREKAENILLWVTAAICLFGLYQFVGDSLGLSMQATGLRLQYTKIVLAFPRIQSVALEPLYFSNYLLVPFFLVAYRTLAGRGGKAANFWLAVLILVDVILGISRGAYLALLVGGVVLAAYAVVSRRAYPGILTGLGRLVGAGALALVVSGVMLYSFDGRTAVSNFLFHANASDSATVSSTSVPGRISVYGTAWGLFKESPVLGKGLGSFGVLTATSADQTARFGYGIVNNEYLELLAETGLVGLLAFLGFIVALAVEGASSWKRANPSRRLKMVSLASGMLAILVQYNFFSTLHILYIWIFAGYLAATIHAEER